MMINKNTFAYRLNIYVVSLITAIALVIFSSYYFVSRNLMLESVEENARNITEKNVNKIDAVISRSAKIPLNIASVIESLEVDSENLLQLLKNMVEKNDEIYGAAIAFEPYMFDAGRYYFAPYVYKDDGKIIQTNLNDAGYEYFFQDWYQIPKYLNKPIWSEPYHDDGGGNTLMTTYSVPFYKTVNGHENLLGIITVDVALNWLDDLVSSINIFETGFAFVVSKAGTIVTHPNETFILNQSIFSLAEEYNIPELRDIGREMVRGENGFKELMGLTLAEESIIYFTPLKSNSWSIAVIFPEKELYANLHNLSWMIIVIGLLGLACIIFTITAVSRKLTAPLISFSAAAKEIGTGKFGAELPQIETSDEIGQLRNSFKNMQEELVTYIENLKKSTSEKEKMQSELRIAHQIQMGMIPKIFPPFPDRDDIDLHAFIDPAKEVGGDLYDFFFIDDDRLVISVGDVAGKGVPASLFMAVTRTLIRSKMIKGVELTEVVDSINTDLVEDNDSKLFVTLLLCIINVKTKEIEFTNAGHNFPYIVSVDGSVNQIKNKHGMALGVIEIKPYESSKYILKDGEKFILYTDGVNEAMDINDKQYDYDRLEKCLRQGKERDAKETINIILEDIKDFTRGAEQSDDITLMAIRLR